MKSTIAQLVFACCLLNAVYAGAQDSGPYASITDDRYAIASFDKKKRRMRLKSDSLKPKSKYIIEARQLAGVKKRMRPNLDERTFETGASVDFFVPNVDVPYAKGLGINFGIIFPNAKKHIALEYLFNLDYCFDPSKNWHARSVGTTENNVTRVPGGFNSDIGLVLSAIIINQHRVSVILGPELMLQSMYLPSPTVTSVDASWRESLLLSFAPGAKASAYIGDQLILNLEYSYCLQSEVTYADYGSYNGKTIVTPISLKILRVGVGLRI